MGDDLRDAFRREFESAWDAALARGGNQATMRAAVQELLRELATAWDPEDCAKSAHDQDVPEGQ